MIQQWEYKVIEKWQYTDLNAALNAAGLEGWELVTPTVNQNGYILRRRVLVQPITAQVTADSCKNEQGHPRCLKCQSVTYWHVLRGYFCPHCDMTSEDAITCQP